MPGKVKFYCGIQGTSLPVTYQEGAIFILERAGTENLGDMYVDISSGKRLHIVPDSELRVYQSSMAESVSSLGQVYIFQELNKIGVAVGDGTTLISNLPIYDYIAITTAIKNKINAYLGTEYLNLTAAQKQTDGLTLPSQSELGETLILSRELWLDL